MVTGGLNYTYSLTIMALTYIQKSIQSQVDATVDLVNQAQAIGDSLG